jgi:uncharacterized protein YbjT (DUF2867 family)
LRSNSKIKAALQAGHSVRALARSARRIPVDHPKLEKMAGDALEMATVKRALTGVDVVTQSLGVSAGPEIILKPTRFFSKATQVLVTAMEEAQVMQEPLQPLRPHNARTRARGLHIWLAGAAPFRRRPARRSRWPNGRVSARG